MAPQELGGFSCRHDCFWMVSGYFHGYAHGTAARNRTRTITRNASNTPQLIGNYCEQHDITSTVVNYLSENRSKCNCSSSRQVTVNGKKRTCYHVSHRQHPLWWITDIDHMFSYFCSLLSGESHVNQSGPLPTWSGLLGLGRRVCVLLLVRCSQSSKGRVQQNFALYQNYKNEN